MDDQQEVGDFLAQGASYGLPGAPVEQIVTHISRLFLIGERVFKLKRAVKFSYLDYSTLERRERFCRAELALNRRTAPGIYLGLSAVTRARDGRLALDGSGAAVDWLVQMHRFDQDDVFDRMAAARRLTPALMRDLADAVAAFHGAAEITRDYGGRDSVARTIAINDENLRLAAPPFERGRIDRLHAGSQAHLARLGPLLEARRAAGKVRRCHGDLHLRNVCLFEGRPTLFDGIEFNDEFACIDVLYDLAFLLMDLVERGREDDANLVLNRYLDRSGESDGLAALPLFQSMRAAVRAHVLGALLRSGKTPPEVQAADGYLALALALLEPHPPRLLALGGLSGTGKSTVAQALAPGFPPAPGARLIRSDVLRKRLAGVAPETRLPRESYTPAVSARVYAALGEEAERALAAGYSAVVDAAFLRAEERRAIAALAAKAGIPFTGLWLEAPAERLEARIAARRGDASDADRAVLHWQRGIDTGPIEWLRVDAAGGVAETVAGARALSATAAPARSSSSAGCG
ncbi:MAG TPA: AAA family ATPase [Stellaceae bacterium]|nr:AAA family ATPase [Stellaceae bacterium]